MQNGNFFYFAFPSGTQTKNIFAVYHKKPNCGACVNLWSRSKEEMNKGRMFPLVFFSGFLVFPFGFSLFDNQPCSDDGPTFALRCTPLIAKKKLLFHRLWMRGWLTMKKSALTLYPFSCGPQGARSGAGGLGRQGM